MRCAVPSTKNDVEWERIVSAREVPSPPLTGEAPRELAHAQPPQTWAAVPGTGDDGLLAVPLFLDVQAGTTVRAPSGVHAVGAIARHAPDERRRVRIEHFVEHRIEVDADIQPASRQPAQPRPAPDVPRLPDTPWPPDSRQPQARRSNPTNNERFTVAILASRHPPRRGPEDSRSFLLVVKRSSNGGRRRDPDVANPIVSSAKSRRADQPSREHSPGRPPGSAGCRPARSGTVGPRA